MLLLLLLLLQSCLLAWSRRSAGAAAAELAMCSAACAHQLLPAAPPSILAQGLKNLHTMTLGGCAPWRDTAAAANDLPQTKSPAFNNHASALDYAILPAFSYALACHTDQQSAPAPGLRPVHRRQLS